MSVLFQPVVAAAYNNFAWLPDGSGFYLSTNLDREFAALAFYSLTDNTLQFLQEPDADVGNVSLSGDGKFLAWTTNEDGYSNLYAIDRVSQTSLTVPKMPPGVYSLDTSSAASSLSVRVTGPDVPGDVYVWDMASNETSQAVQSSLAGLDPASFKVPESLRYLARDGVELQGLLYLPDESATTSAPPVLVNVHGGPTSQSRPTFKPEIQYLVDNGIAVFDVNVRGSTGCRTVAP